MLIIRYLFLYVIILSFSIFIADRLNKKVEHTIALSFITIIIILYIFGIVHQLFLGVIVTTILSITLLLYTILKNIKNKTGNDLKEKVITTGNLFFTIVFFVFLITTVNREITHWDQFSYWSVAAKDMYSTNRISLTTQAITQYPPVPTILQYFFMKILGEYRQGIEIFTTWMLGISFFLPLFEKSNGRKLVNFMISTIIVCVPAVFSVMIFYESSYPDALLGIVTGYLSYIYFFEKDSKFKKICILMGLILLTLTKATGIIFAGISLVCFFVLEVLTKKQNKQKIKEILNAKEVKNLILYLGIVFIVYMSWSVYLKTVQPASDTINTIENVTTASKFEAVIQSIKTTIWGSYQENNEAADSNGSLIETLYNTTEIVTPVKISTIGLISIFIIIALLSYYRSNQEDKVCIKNITICTLLGIVLYIVALQFAYITQFSSKEMLKHAGIDRYIASYLLAILYIVVATILHFIKEKKTTKNLPYVILTSVILLITPINSIANATITSGIYNLNTILYCNIGRARTNKILEQIGDKEGKKILGICQKEETKLINLMVRYYIYPISYHAEEIIKEKTLQEVLKENNYDYIYIIESDEYLNTQLYECFGIQHTGKDVLYKINDMETLEKISE